MKVRKVSNTKNRPSRSFKGIGNRAIRQATYDFLLVLHYNYICILHR